MRTIVKLFPQCECFFSFSFAHLIYYLIFIRYRSKLTNEEVDFLKLDLFSHRDKANWLSERLIHAEDVVLEANRIHYQLFRHLLQGISRAIFINVFKWVNRGDYVITLAQRQLLKQFNISLVSSCIYIGESRCRYDEIAKTKDLAIFIQGGGYFGDFSHAKWIQEEIENFPLNQRIIFFPNSLSSRVGIGYLNKFLSKYSDVHVMLRDKFSYDVSSTFQIPPFKAIPPFYVYPDCHRTNDKNSQYLSLSRYFFGTGQP